jgi:RimJ/RimL family protein N-acetyltransferase
MKTPSLDSFRTNRLVAERLRPEHLSEYLRLFQDARVMATLPPDGKPLPDDEAARWLRLSLEHWDRHGYGRWVIRTRAGNRFVGRAGLKDLQAEGQNAVELSYALLPEFWGQGLATELARKIVELAFEHLGAPAVIGYTLTTNRASRRVMEKIGFRLESEGVYAGLPHATYRLTAAEFRNEGD